MIWILYGSIPTHIWSKTYCPAMHVSHHKNTHVNNHIDGLVQEGLTPLLTHWSYIFLALSHRHAPSWSPGAARQHPREFDTNNTHTIMFDPLINLVNSIQNSHNRPPFGLPVRVRYGVSVFSSKSDLCSVAVITAPYMNDIMINRTVL